ncbi:hypothetical protein MC885_014883, partial [Smutsia gigantea]
MATKEEQPLGPVTNSVVPPVPSLAGLWVHRFGKLNSCCHKIISHGNDFNCFYNCIQPGNDTTKYSWKYHLPPCLSGQQCDYSSHLRTVK